MCPSWGPSITTNRENNADFSLSALDPAETFTARGGGRFTLGGSHTYRMNLGRCGKHAWSVILEIKVTLGERHDLA